MELIYLLSIFIRLGKDSPRAMKRYERTCTSSIRSPGCSCADAAREEGKSITVPVIGKGLAPDGLDSPYSTMHPINNNTLPQMQNPGVLTPTPGLPFFSSAPPPPPSLPSSAEDMSRLRDRLMLNSLMTQPGFGLAAAWLNNLPKPIPTTKPMVDLVKGDTREEDECEVNVDNDSHTDDDKLNVSSSESDEGKSLVIKRTESPCENGSATSSDGTSSSAHSPVNLFKQHQISRMFMCRCCNWAFPDKTSLHMHIQAREEGKSITVPVIGKGLAPDGLDSPYSTMHPINNNTLPQMQNPGGEHAHSNPRPAVLLQRPAPPPSLPSSAEDMSRLRDRLMLNSLMTQPGFGLAAAWLNNLPKPIPTTKPMVDLVKGDTREEDECEVNVDNDSHTDDDKLNVSSSESDEGKSLVIKRTESPCENGSATSSDGTSSSAHSPVNLFKKGDAPSAFHHLNVDSRFVVSPSHVSPSETHSSASPNGCYDCAVYKTKLTMADNKCRYLESRGNTLQTEAVRAQAQISSAEAALRALEAETRALREQTEMLHRRLLDCQEQAVRFMQCDRVSNPQAVALFMNHLIQSTIIR
ncbi:hypothetical protein ANCDUO_14337 [Ancylostoma duodenale]|uniref:C2H2-type domain-containing protein n=1 Tax=Ancylostoma duodenale TaxID=51022 RepID=A0A0C2G3K3_9BILA|nr:hypothetical protein ANCDUO_14337 [Ancylostoma duodenale]